MFTLCRTGTCCVEVSGVNHRLSPLELVALTGVLGDKSFPLPERHSVAVNLFLLFRDPNWKGSVMQPFTDWPLADLPLPQQPCLVLS